MPTCVCACERDNAVCSAGLVSLCCVNVKRDASHPESSGGEPPTPHTHTDTHKHLFFVTINCAGRLSLDLILGDILTFDTIREKNVLFFNSLRMRVKIRCDASNSVQR